MVEEVDPQTHELSFDAIAQVLKVPRETLPLEGFAVQPSSVPSKVRWQVALKDVELSGDEIQVVIRCLPHGVPHRSRNDAQFISACLAHQRLQLLGKSWWYLDPDVFGPISSNAGRSARWDRRGWWRALYDALAADGGLSPDRLDEFASLADASAGRHKKRTR